MQVSENEDDWQREAAEEEADRQRKAEPAPALGGDDFLAWRSPRRGSAHPTRVDNALWQWLVRTRWNAYQANRIYSGPSSSDAGPMWTFDRFGMSETVLPDGRAVHIAGEHEDFYDPDFFIYNDVTVVGPDGKIEIYAYPADDFPPTDFHSATLVGGVIFMVGCLGYPEQRVLGVTPVYALELASMRIRKVETRGPAPGWIHEHSAELAEDGVSLRVAGGQRWMGGDFPIVDNTDDWLLDTRTGEWRRLTERAWPHWLVVRVDRKRSRVRDVRQEAWNRRHAHLGMQSYWHHDDPPDVAALERLYRFDGDASPVEGPEYGTYCVVVDGVRVRFKEEGHGLEVIVEGHLTEDRLGALQRETRALIERLEGAPCEVLDVNARTSSARR